MFEQLAGSQDLLEATTLFATTTDVNFTVFDRRTGSIAVVIKTAARTTGSITAVLLASFDSGATYPATLGTTGSVSTNGVKYILPGSPIPAYLKLRITKAGGFDGTVAVRQRAAGLTETD